MTTKTAPAPISLPIGTREGILAIDDRKVELVQVPEWGIAVWVRSLEGIERDQYEGSSIRYKRGANGAPVIDRLDTDNVRARLCAMTMVASDEPGALNLFTPADVLVLGHKSAAALNRVWEVAQRLSNLNDAAIDAARDELGKDPSSDSGIG